MSRLRSISLPRFHNAAANEASTPGGSPYICSPSHSRGSSATSTNSSPITLTSSVRGHQRWPSSSSSLATTPDSPVNVSKPALHDLVEDPAERDDPMEASWISAPGEPLCICDTTVCEHRRISHAQQPFTRQLPTPEWSAGDDYFSDIDPEHEMSHKRRRSGETAVDGLTARLSRRFPSLSRRWRDPVASVASTATTRPTVHSAPASRAPSLKLAPVSRSSVAPSDRASDASLAPYSICESLSETNVSEHSRHPPFPDQAVAFNSSRHIEEPFDRKEMSSTPLLPPMMDGYRSHSAENLEVVSPLQSPTVAEMSTLPSAASTPVLPSYPTPPLSTKPSASSFSTARPAHLTSDIPSMSIHDETDPWAIKLGHANFHIYPEPYMPVECDLRACKELLEKWEAARMEYLRQTMRISEHYGPTSRIYKLTEEKWASIDAQWRTFHERANAEAQAKGQAPRFQPLAEHQLPLSKMPSLNDPDQPSKFPRIDDADIVGPMVQYAKVQRPPSKRATLLKIFTDRAALLGGRSAMSGFRR